MKTGKTEKFPSLIMGDSRPRGVCHVIKGSAGKDNLISLNRLGSDSE